MLRPNNQAPCFKTLNVSITIQGVSVHGSKHLPSNKESILTHNSTAATKFIRKSVEIPQKILPCARLELSTCLLAQMVVEFARLASSLNDTAGNLNRIKRNNCGYFSALNSPVGTCKRCSQGIIISHVPLPSVSQNSY